MLVPDSASTEAVSVPSSKEEKLRASVDFYQTASLPDILSSLSKFEGDVLHMKDSSVLEHNSWAVSKIVFARICAANPRIAQRYDDGRLVRKMPGTQALDFDIMSKWPSGWDAIQVLHVYHSAEDGTFVRDVYHIDPSGNAKFHSYVTQDADQSFEADVDLAIAHGRMKEPKMSDYSGTLPPTVYDPLSHTGKVRATVGRIIDGILL